MPAVDIKSQQTHDDNLEEEVQGGNIEQTEEEEPRRTEVKREQAIPLHQWE